MVIRLTESRLRQIIREEASKLSRRRLRESGDGSRSAKYSRALNDLVSSIEDGDFWASMRMSAGASAEAELADSPEMQGDPMMAERLLFKDLVARGVDREIASKMAEDIAHGNEKGYY